MPTVPAITASTIDAAMRAFDKGKLPFRFVNARTWFIVGRRGRLYPLKYIYAMAIGKAPSSFNTSRPIAEVGSLEGVKLIQTLTNERAEFEAKVRAATKRTSATRLERIRKANPRPIKRLVTIAIYERSPDVVAEVLPSAKGMCSNCYKRAPFKKRTDGSPYLEVHHIHQLAKGGDDTPENAVALCPNCHRKFHHGTVARGGA
jgi:5-methylcytosine-specific restriction enzyme A